MFDPAHPYVTDLKLARPQLPFTELKRLLSYDPKAGALFWRVDVHPYVKAGDEAGTIGRDGYLLVAIKGKKYPAHRLAWALTHGKWPEGRVYLKSARDPKLSIDEHFQNRSDIRLANLGEEDDALSTDVRAQYGREYRKRRRLEREAYEQDDDLRLSSDIEHVRWDNARRLWLVFHPQYKGKDGSPGALVIGEFTARKNAEQLYLALTDRLEWLKNNPPPATTSRMLTYTAGRGRHTLAHLHQLFAYRPDTGEILFRGYRGRDTARQGFPAAKPLRNGNWVVTHEGLTYPAAMLAWFLQTGEWPRPKTIRPRNRRKADLRWANLEKVMELPE